MPPARLVWLVLGPLLFGVMLFNPLGISLPLASTMLGVLLFMGTYWISEVIPLCVTGLIPVAFFPLAGILSAEETAKAYMSDGLMLFLGSFMLGLAMEKHLLHKRIALAMLIRIGNRPALLLFGMIFSTLIVSMFMSNTSTVAVIAPLGVSIIRQFGQLVTPTSQSTAFESIAREDVEMAQDPETSEQHTFSHDNPHPHLLPSHHSSMTESESFHHDELITDKDHLLNEPTTSSPTITPHPNPNPALIIEEPSLGVTSTPDDAVFIGKAMMLGTAYAANTGGTATPIGTGPNLVLISVIAAMFPSSPGVPFSHWFAFAFPLSILQATGIFGFLWLRYVKGRLLLFDVSRLVEEHRQLGEVTLAEKVISLDVVLVILLWATRSGLGSWLPGWKELFPYPPGDGSVSIFCALLLFVWDIVDWRTDMLNLSWDIIVLLGGGTAMAIGCGRSGLSNLVAAQMESLGDLPFLLQIMCISALMTSTTELISNIAAANLALPILGSLAQRIHTNPFLFMLPATISSSYAFMFPISTPPNAIVFSYGLVSIREMAFAGFILNICGILSLTFWTVLVGPLILGAREAAEWVYT